MVESHINSDRRDGWELQKTVVKTTNGGRRIVSEKLTVKSCRSVGKKSYQKSQKRWLKMAVKKIVVEK